LFRRPLSDRFCFTAKRVGWIFAVIDAPKFQFVDNLRPPCSRCGRPLVLTRIEPWDPGFDLWSIIVLTVRISRPSYQLSECSVQRAACLTARMARQHKIVPGEMSATGLRTLSLETADPHLGCRDGESRGGPPTRKFATDRPHFTATASRNRETSVSLPRSPAATPSPAFRSATGRRGRLPRPGRT
jgi:hypothetical protein